MFRWFFVGPFSTSYAFQGCGAMAVIVPRSFRLLDESLGSKEVSAMERPPFLNGESESIPSLFWDGFRVGHWRGKSRVIIAI